MLGNVNWSNPHEIESAYRSVAMLPTQSDVTVQRENLLKLLTELKNRPTPGTGPS